MTIKKAGEYKNLIVYKPTIAIPYDIIAQIKTFVNGTDAKECQWFHTINRTMFRNSNRVVYTFNGMYIPEQEISAAYVESDPVKGLMGLWKELQSQNLKEDGTADNEAMNAIVSKMNVWAHSHVMMACSPSGTDEATFKQWWTQAEAQESTEPSVMMIVNKKDEFYIRLYDPLIGTYFENPDIEITYPEVDCSYVQDALKNKLKTKTWSHQAGFQGSRHGESFGVGSHVRVIQGGQNSNPTLVGETDSPGKAGSTALLETSSIPGVPTWSRAGKAMMNGQGSGIEQDVIKISTSNTAEIEAERLTKAISVALSDIQELYVFRALLRDDTESVEALVQVPKTLMPNRDELLIDIQSNLVNAWCAHPNYFYALVCVSGRICNITGETRQKRIKHLEVYLKELKKIEDDWGVQALAGLASEAK
jgi:hypothetical protein